MSHTKKIVLIGDQFITVNNSKEINIHDNKIKEKPCHINHERNN
jgi:hypothetical protein